MSSPSENPVFDPLKRVLLEMAGVGDLSALLPWLVSRLVESCESATASAIWEVGSKEMCSANTDHENADPDGCVSGVSGENCLHLSTLATRSARGMIVTSNPDLERAFRRLPLTALDSEFDMPIPKPLGVDDNRRWFPLRLIHRQKLVGAMAVFFREGHDPSTMEMLQLIANQLASDITSERACEEVRRLQQQLDSSQGMPRPAPGTAVVSEADIRRFERSNIAAALEATGGRVYGRGGAAELLGLKPTTLASRLKKLGLTSRT